MGEKEERRENEGNEEDGSEEEHCSSRSHFQRERELRRIRADFPPDLAISNLMVWELEWTNLKWDPSIIPWRCNNNKNDKALSLKKKIIIIRVYF